MPLSDQKRKNSLKEKETEEAAAPPPPASLVKDLRTLLMTGTAANQEELCATLAAKGHHVNQSKVSRLLRKIGAIKAKNEQGEIVYRLPREPAPPPTSAELSSLVIEITANETMIVVSTSPGSAQLIARILDHHRQELKILGSIAGDDTILIVPASIKTIAASVKELHSILENRRH